MKSTRILRIASLLALIFVAGAATGWLASARRAGESASAQDSSSEEVRTGTRIRQRERKIYTEINEVVHLSAEQTERLRPLLKAWGQEVLQAERSAVREKREATKRMMPLIRTNLTAEQWPAFDRMLEQVHKK